MFNILAKEESKEGNVEKNIDAFAQLIQCLDDRSLSLVMRDAKDDGRKALKILRNHYMGKSKPRLLALYTELTSLQKGHDECITDYVLLPETAAASLSAPDGTKFAIKKRGKLYHLNSTISSSGAHTAETWHRILGHCNMNDVLKLEGVVEGMKITSKDKPECGTCVQGKMSQYQNREPDRRATAPLQLVHSDLAGPVTPVSKEGHKYAMVFVDDFSGAFGVYFLKNKSDATRATEQFLADTAPYGSVKRLRSDNGGEYISEEFKSLLLKNHIKHETSAPYSPHQNGTAERAWRSIFDMARSLLIDTELPRQFWTYAVMTSAHIRNRCYNPRTGKNPYECLTGIKPNLSNMHVFGSVCYAYVQNTTKLDPRAEKGIFVGYGRSSPAFLVYCPQAKTVKKVRCVKFTENFDNVDETVELLPDSVKPGEPEMPTHENEDANVRRYPAREHVRPKYLDDYVTGDDIDDAIDDTANCTIDFCTIDFCTIDFCYCSPIIPRCHLIPRGH